MKILVTGAAGFVGSTLLPRLIAAGHEVIGARLPGDMPAGGAPTGPVRWITLDLRDSASVASALETRPDALIHLAAVASGAEARRDPGLAWEVNAAGTARLADGFGRVREEGRGDPLLLLVSTAEVYGAAPVPRLRQESDPVVPVSPYAASKAAAELAVLEASRRTGLRVIVARPFPHTGPGQTDRYAVPAFARRLADARRKKETRVRTGNLEPVRDFLDVRDVVEAYLALVEKGQPGQIYNVASGEGRSLREIFARLAAIVGVDATPEVDPSLARSADLLHLVGDPTRLNRATGWTPRIPFDQTLQDLVHAQTD